MGAQPREATAQHFLLSAPCPLSFQLLPWPLATPTPTAPWQCPPGEEPDLVSSPCPPGKAREGQGRASQGPQAWLLDSFSPFPSHRTQGRVHGAGPAPRAPSPPRGAPAHASPTPAAAFKEGWRPGWAQRLKTHGVGAASLGEPHSGAWGLMLSDRDAGSWGPSLTLPLSRPQPSGLWNGWGRAGVCVWQGVRPLWGEVLGLTDIVLPRRRFAPSEAPRVPCQPCSQTPLGPRGCDGEWPRGAMTGEGTWGGFW